MGIVKCSYSIHSDQYTDTGACSYNHRIALCLWVIYNSCMGVSVKMWFTLDSHLFTLAHTAMCTPIHIHNTVTVLTSWTIKTREQQYEHQHGYRIPIVNFKYCAVSFTDIICLEALRLFRLFARSLACWCWCCERVGMRMLTAHERATNMNDVAVRCSVHHTR